MGANRSYTSFPLHNSPILDTNATHTPLKSGTSLGGMREVSLWWTPDHQRGCLQSGSLKASLPVQGMQDHPPSSPELGLL
jgi:hypothetical protein